MFDLILSDETVVLSFLAGMFAGIGLVIFVICWACRRGQPHPRPLPQYPTDPIARIHPLAVIRVLHKHTNVNP